MPRTSSEGERQAVRGFTDQYLYSAHLIHGLLFGKDRSLDWIWLLDKDALSIDDFQYAEPGVVHAFQVKWMEYPGTKGWSSLLGPDGDKPPMIGQLAKTWLSLRHKHPLRRVVVHLIHNSHPSNDKSKAHGVSLAEFLKHAWSDVQADSAAFRADEGVWSDLISASGLSEDQFREFVPHCFLEYGVVQPKEHDDVRAITNWLFRVVHRGGDNLRFTRAELLDELGWASDYSAPTQEFKVPAHYEEIDTTAAELRRRIAETSNGYIAVLGSPGSGKSTLLTKVLSTTANIRLIKYYAYAPDDRYAARGEATDFLHSITLQLERSGVFVRAQKRPARGERLRLTEFLEAQLQQCHAEFGLTGLKTVVLVDGLDHIERELQPERSLLKDLLPPDSLPEGVLFVLGSQRLVLEGLPNAVKVNIEAGNVVDMGRMSTEAMERTIDAVIPEAEDLDRRRIREVAEGHPLALNYLLELLRSRSREEWDFVLQSTDRFTGDVDVLYRKHWNDIDPDAALRNTLGLMARFRGPVPMRLVQEWMEPRVADLVGKNLRHYFDVKRDGSWSFFHNSFRLFLQAQTCMPLLSGTPDELDRSFHRELAVKLRQAPAPWCWDALSHDYRAGEHVSVRSIVSLGHFKEQVMAFRHPNAVLEDLELVMKAAVELNDPLLLVRAILISADIEQRHDAFDDEAITESLIRLGDVVKAMAYMLDGNRMRVTMKVALHACAVLAEQGSHVEGERLFKIAQPIECLTFKPIGRTLGDHEEASEVLRAWAISAPYFMDATALLSSVDQLRFEPEEHSRDTPEQLAREGKSNLLYCIADSFAERRRWGDWGLAHARLKDLSGTLALLALTNALQSCEGSDAEGREMLLALLVDTERSIVDDADPMDRTAMALRVVKIALDMESGMVATEWGKSIERVPLYATGIRWNDGMLVRWAFRKAMVDVRLSGSVSDNDLELDEAVTEWPEKVDHDTRERARLVRRAVYDMVAFTRCDSRHLNAVQSGGALRWIVDLMVDDQTASMHRKLYLDRVRPELIHCLVEVLHSKDDKGAFVDYCRDSWPVRYQRMLARELTNFGSNDFVEVLLDGLLMADRQGGQPYNRVADIKEHVELRILIGSHDRAKAILRELVAVARGPISEKDYQWATWADWLVRANKQDPASALARDEIMLGRLLAMQGDSTDAGQAIDTMLVDLYRMRPGAAVTLTRVLQERGDVDHAIALSAALLMAIRGEDVSCLMVLLIMEDLLVPFSWVGDINLLSELFVKLKSHSGTERLLDAAVCLVQTIRAKASHKDRYSWFFHLKNALDAVAISPQAVGITPDELVDPRQQDEERPPMLHLEGELVLPVAEVAGRVRNVSDYKVLRARQDPSKPYSSDWAALAGLVVDSAEPEELESWVEVVESEFEGRKGVRILADIAKRVHESGRTASAKKIAHAAVMLCDAGGWIQMFDGGSKIKAINSLRSIDKRASIAVALKELGGDCGNGSLQYKLLIQGLGDIVPLLFDEVPWIQLWHLTDEYLTEYCAGHSQPVEEVSTVLKKALDGAQDRSRSLVGVLCLYLDHPSHHVASAAIRCIARVILEPDTDARALIAELGETVQRSERVLINLLVALQAVAMHDRAKAVAFEGLVAPCLCHPNLLIRIFAQRLANDDASQEVEVERVDRELPFLYRLKQPQFIESANHRIAPFKYVMDALADRSRLDIGQCLARWENLFASIETRRTWLKRDVPLSDDELKRFIDRTVGRIDHIRARIHPTMFAILHCIGEIWDAGCIDRFSVMKLIEELLHHDPALVLREPMPLPSQFTTDMGLEGSVSWSRLPDGWVDPPADALAKLKRSYDQRWVVLAERTIVRAVASDSVVEETRTSGHFDSKIWLSRRTKNNLPFISPPRPTTEEYFSWSDIGAEHLVIANSSLICETPGFRWIAVNPVVARAFGLKAGTGLFQWVNDHGDPAIETIWFSGGGLLNHAPGSRSAVVEGFIVVCSPSIKEELETRGLRHQGLIVRIVDKNGHLRTGSVSDSL
jgi:hypothetical protein